ncbi:MAG: peptidylprolyl isomerase [Mariniblastus sp.]
MAPSSKNTFAFSLAIAALCCSSVLAQQNQRPQQQQGQQTQQRIERLATVNGKAITRHQITHECMRRYGDTVLKSLINKLLIQEQLRVNNIVITEKDINDDLAAKAQKVGLATDRYVQTICTGRNISVDTLKNSIVWEQLALKRLAEQNIQVTPAEMAEQMEYEFGARVQVRQIVVDSLQQAKQIQAQLSANPENFERMAKQFSLDQNTKAIGGLLHPIRKNSGLPEFEQVAFALQPGQVSNVFPISNQFVILRCERIFPAEQLSPEQQTAMHERLYDKISMGKLANAANEMFTKLQAESKIVNVMNDPQLSKQNPGVAATVNGIKILKTRVGEECIDRFGTEMLETEINRTILLQAIKSVGIQVEPKDIDSEIARAAESIGHLNKDGTVNVNEWLAFVTDNDMSKVDFYIEDEVWPTVALKKFVTSKVEVTQEDMNKGFEANYGPRVEVLAMVLDDHRRALKYWGMASSNPTAEFFGKLANQYSIEPASKANFGAVPPIRKHGGRPELEKEAFSLKSGELSKVVQVGEHWIILFCQGRTEPVVTDFDVVKDELYKNILEKKMRLAMSETFQQLREQAQIDNYMVGTSQPGADAVRAARAQQQQQRPAASQGGGRVPFRR